MESLLTRVSVVAASDSLGDSTTRHAFGPRGWADEAEVEG